MDRPNENVNFKIEPDLSPTNGSYQNHPLWFSIPDNTVEICPRYNDVTSLLKFWKQEHLIPCLIGENIDINVLKVMKQHHIKDVLKDFKMGDQILFEHNLDVWRKQIGFPLYSGGYSAVQSISPCESVRERSERRSCRSSPYTVFENLASPPPSLHASPGPSTSNFVTLSKILSETNKGQLITKFYEENNRFKDEHRILLINVIANYFHDTKSHLSLATSYRIENEIISQFPTEKAEFYRTGKRGKIYAKYCNMKRSFNSLLTKVTEGDKSELPENDLSVKKLIPETDAEQSIRSLRNDTLSTEEFDNLWRSCSQYRINEIINEMTTLKEILSKWPEYKRPNGYRLIDYDFTIMHPDSSCILENWEENFKKLRHFLMDGNRIKDKEINAILSTVGEEDFRQDYAVLQLLWCTHGFLVPTQKLVKIDNAGKKTVFKYTIKDSQNAFIYVGETLQQIEEHLNFIKTKSEHIQPFILVVGDIGKRKFDQFLLYVDGVKLEFFTFLRAVDICFKIFHLFNLEYPTACEHFWTFIEKFFYKNDKNFKNKSSKVAQMLEELK